MAGWFFHLALLIWDLGWNYKQLLQHLQIPRQKWGWLRESAFGLFRILVVFSLGNETPMGNRFRISITFDMNETSLIVRIHVFNKYTLNVYSGPSNEESLLKLPTFCKCQRQSPPNMVPKGIHSLIWPFSYLIRDTWGTLPVQAQ